ncbi:MAG: DUF4124 domain-containing protein [Betaproteobacteria bacterium]
MKFLTLTSLPVSLPVSMVAAAALASLATLTAMPAHALFKCQDEKGVTHYGDTMPPQCAKKAITEMTGQGSIVNRYEAPLTPEQIKAQAEERERRRDTDKKIAEQKLRDFALISTYGSEREFDMARDKDLAALDARKRTLRTRNEDVDKQLSKLQNEMEFYKAGKSKTPKGKDGKEVKETKDAKDAKDAREAPPQLVQDFNRARNDRTGLDNELVKVDADRAAVTAKYDSEKNRWKKLKGGMPTGTLLDEKGEVAITPDMPSQIVGKISVIPGRPRGIATCEGKAYECTLGIPYFCAGPNVGGPGVNIKQMACVEARR